MTVAITIVSLALIFMSVVVVALLFLLNELREENREEYVSGEYQAHAKCIAAVASYVGDEYAAQVLDAAAQDWDSIEENHRLKVLARLRYTSDGPSVPAIWMTDRADRLRGAEDVTHP